MKKIKLPKEVKVFMNLAMYQLSISKITFPLDSWISLQKMCHPLMKTFEFHMYFIDIYMHYIDSDYLETEIKINIGDSQDDCDFFSMKCLFLMSEEEKATKWIRRNVTQLCRMRHKKLGFLLHRPYFPEETKQ